MRTAMLLVLVACGSTTNGERPLPPDPFADAASDGECCADVRVDTGGEFDRLCPPVPGATAIFATGDAAGVTVDPTALYWLFRGSPPIVTRAPLTGAPVAFHELSAGEEALAVASDGVAVAWLARVGKTTTLFRKALDGGSATLVASRSSSDEGGSFFALAASSKGLHAATATTLLRFGSTSTPVVVGALSMPALALAADDNQVAVVTYASVDVFSDAGHVVVVDEKDYGRPGRVALGNAHVYWEKGAALVRAPTSGGPVTTFATEADDFRVAGGNVYYAVGAGPSSIRVQPESSTTGKVLVERPRKVFMLAVTAGRLFWFEPEFDGAGVCVFRWDTPV
ncbi:MAG: hypothetical protein JNL79_17270 [Myxococcales bacterium]|nr:hypothetical protein [Myxococcales bacterium]